MDKLTTNLERGEKTFARPKLVRVTYWTNCFQFRILLSFVTGERRVLPVMSMVLKTEIDPILPLMTRDTDRVSHLVGNLTFNNMQNGSPEQREGDTSNKIFSPLLPSMGLTRISHHFNTIKRQNAAITAP